MAARVPDAEELADDLSRIEQRLVRMEEKLDQRYVPRELYEARHTALRSEIALELAGMKRDQEASHKVAEGAKALSMWALGLITSAVVVAMVGFLVAGVPA